MFLSFYNWNTSLILLLLYLKKTWSGSQTQSKKKKQEYYYHITETDIKRLYFIEFLIIEISISFFVLYQSLISSNSVKIVLDF